MSPTTSPSLYHNTHTHDLTETLGLSDLEGEKAFRNTSHIYLVPFDLLSCLLSTLVMVVLLVYGQFPLHLPLSSSPASVLHP